MQPHHVRLRTEVRLKATVMAKSYTSPVTYDLILPDGRVVYGVKEEDIEVPLVIDDTRWSHSDKIIPMKSPKE